MIQNRKKRVYVFWSLACGQSNPKVICSLDKRQSKKMFFSHVNVGPEGNAPSRSDCVMTDVDEPPFDSNGRTLYKYEDRRFDKWFVAYLFEFVKDQQFNENIMIPVHCCAYFENRFDYAMVVDVFDEEKRAREFCKKLYRYCSGWRFREKERSTSDIFPMHFGEQIMIGEQNIPPCHNDNDCWDNVDYDADNDDENFGITVKRWKVVNATEENLVIFAMAFRKILGKDLIKWIAKHTQKMTIEEVTRQYEQLN